MKISIFFLFAFISLSTFGEDSYHLHLFTYDRNGKVMSIKEVKFQQNKLFVDGQELSALEASIKAKFLRPVFKAVADKKNVTCSAGNFILRVSKSKKDMIENGCLDSKRYFELVDSFDKMKKDVVLK